MSGRTFTPAELGELRKLLLAWIETIAPLWNALGATAEAKGAIAAWLRSHTVTGPPVADLNLNLPVGYAAILDRTVRCDQAIGGVIPTLKAVPLDDVMDLRKELEEGP